MAASHVRQADESSALPDSNWKCKAPIWLRGGLCHVVVGIHDARLLASKVWSRLPDVLLVVGMAALACLIGPGKRSSQWRKHWFVG